MTAFFPHNNGCTGDQIITIRLLPWSEIRGQRAGWIYSFSGTATTQYRRWGGTGLKPQKFISHSSLQDQRVPRAGFFCDLSLWLADVPLLPVSSRGPPSGCLCPNLISSSYKDTTQKIGLGPIHMTSLYFKYPFKDYFQI